MRAQDFVRSHCFGETAVADARHHLRAAMAFQPSGARHE